MMNKYITRHCRRVKTKGLQMSEGKIKDEFNADNVNFELHNDTAKIDIETPADTVDNATLDKASLHYSNEKDMSDDAITVLDSDSEVEEADISVATVIEEAPVNESDAPMIIPDEQISDNTEESFSVIESERDESVTNEADADEVLTENEFFPEGESSVTDGEVEEDESEEFTDADGEILDSDTDGDELDSDRENAEAIDDDGSDESVVEEDIDYDAFLDEEEEVEKKKVGTRFVDSLFDFIELFIFSLAAVFIITTFFFRHSVVDGSSMERTLFDGEHIIISDLFYKPERGDIIVCEDYSTELPIPIVKRVIAIAGDRVEIDTAGNVKVNGELLDESGYVYIDPYHPYHCDEISLTVPEGEIFVMGDHRNVSSDSRKIGTIKEDSILGKVLFRFYPFDKFGRVE